MDKQDACRAAVGRNSAMTRWHPSCSFDHSRLPAAGSKKRAANDAAYAIVATTMPLQ
jgi:hypothetical protein